MKGQVKFFNQGKGFGFIAGDDGKEYFVHQTGLQEGVSLNEGDNVDFEVTEGDRGPKAVNVVMAGGSDDSGSEEEKEETEDEAEESTEDKAEDYTEDKAEDSEEEKKEE